MEYMASYNTACALPVSSHLPCALAADCSGRHGHCRDLSSPRHKPNSGEHSMHWAGKRTYQASPMHCRLVCCNGLTSSFTWCGILWPLSSQPTSTRRSERMPTTAIIGTFRGLLAAWVRLTGWHRVIVPLNESDGLMAMADYMMPDLLVRLLAPFSSCRPVTC